MEMTHMMVKQQYTVSFVTPAFLGDADQNGAWRTPPFKALLRQWWRVAAAKNHNYDHTRLRETEGRLFGNAWMKDQFCQSQIKLRLDKWRTGKMLDWAETPKNISHPEIKFPIDSNLYLGYGPLTRNRETKKTTFKDKLSAAIQAEESNTLKIIHSDQSSSAIHKTLQLIHWFGTIGGRSRNGWGSLFLEGSELRGLELLNQSNSTLKELAKPLNECLKCDWPHAFANDKDGLLIWKSQKINKTWREAMVELAKIKIAFRTHNFVFSRNKDAVMPRIDYRHLLGYPVTHHGVEGWCDKDEKTGKLKTDKHGYLKQSARLANQLRFKVSKTTQGYIGVAYNLPCGIPNELLIALSKADRDWIVDQQLTVWQSVHAALDKQMQRIP
jgi:CRISPR-associated protein Cmr1